MGSGLPQFGLPRRLAIIRFVLPFQMYEGVFQNNVQGLDSQQLGLVSDCPGKISGFRPPRVLDNLSVKTTYYKPVFLLAQPVARRFWGSFAAKRSKGSECPNGRGRSLQLTEKP